MNTPPAQITVAQSAVAIRDLPYAKALAEVTRHMKPIVGGLRAVIGPAVTDEIQNSLYVLIMNAHLDEGVSSGDVKAAVRSLTRLDSLSGIEHSNQITTLFARHLKAAHTARRRTEETLARRQADERERAEAISPDDVRRNLAIVRGILGRFTSQVGKGRPHNTEDATRGDEDSEEAGG